MTPTPHPRDKRPLFTPQSGPPYDGNGTPYFTLASGLSPDGKGGEGAKGGSGSGGFDELYDKGGRRHPSMYGRP